MSTATTEASGIHHAIAGITDKLLAAIDSSNDPAVHKVTASATFNGLVITVKVEDKSA